MAKHSKMRELLAIVPRITNTLSSRDIEAAPFCAGLRNLAVADDLWRDAQKRLLFRLGEFR